MVFSKLENEFFDFSSIDNTISISEQTDTYESAGGLTGNFFAKTFGVG